MSVNLQVTISVPGPCKVCRQIEGTLFVTDGVNFVYLCPTHAQQVKSGSALFSTLTNTSYAGWDDIEIRTKLEILLQN